MLAMVRTAIVPDEAVVVIIIIRQLPEKYPHMQTCSVTVFLMKKEMKSR